MSSKSESGYARLRGNFKLLVEGVRDFDNDYNPSHISLKLSSLEALNSRAADILITLNGVLPAFNNARIERQEKFKDLNVFITRIVGAAKGCRLSDAELKNVNHWVKKIRGVRITPISENMATISTSQQSFDMKLDFLDKFVAELEHLPGYVPNELDLRGDSLRNHYNGLVLLNNRVKELTFPVSTARHERDIIFFAPVTGLTDTALAVKEYVKSINGTKDARYQKIKKLSFPKR